MFTKEDSKRGSLKRWKNRGKFIGPNPYILLFNRLKTNSSVRRGRIKILICEDDIENLFVKQNGVCALSGIKMVLDRKSIYSISVDRIDNLKDYTNGNIRLVCQVVNTMRGLLSDELLIDFCKNIIKTNCTEEPS